MSRRTYTFGVQYKESDQTHGHEETGPLYVCVFIPREREKERGASGPK